MALPGYNASVKVAGTAVAFTNSATTKLTSNTRYQLTNTAHQRLDPSAAVTVEVDADGAGAGSYATAAASTYTVDYAFGIITFASDQGSSALVRVSGSYLPVHTVAESRRVTINRTRDELEDTVFGDTAKSYVAGQRAAEGEIEGLDLGTTDLDAGGDTLTMEALFDGSTAKMLEVTIGSYYFRAWVKLFGIDRNVSPSELITATIRWKACAPTGNGQTEKAIFGMGT